MAKDNRIVVRGRDTDTGRFKPLDKVTKRDIRESVPKPGYGDTKKK